MSAGVIIRRAERRDLETLGRLGAMLVRTHYAFDQHRFLAPVENTERDYAWFLGRVLQSDDDRVFVAEQDGVITGYVYATLEPMSWMELRGPAGFISDIAVAEDARRTGVATKLMKAAIDWVRGRGMPRVMLWTAVPNAGARALFRHLGFRETMIEMTMDL